MVARWFDVILPYVCAVLHVPLSDGKRSSCTAGAVENPLSIGMELWIESSDEVDEGPCQAVETTPLVADNGQKRLRLSLRKPKATSGKENLPADRFQFVSDTKAEALGNKYVPKNTH